MPSLAFALFLFFELVLLNGFVFGFCTAGLSLEDLAIEFWLIRVLLVLVGRDLVVIRRDVQGRARVEFVN